MSDPLFRIKHPTLGYFENITRTQYDASKYFETWTHDAAKAAAYTAEKLQQPMDANGYGLFKLLVCGYGGLKLEEAEAVEYRARKKTAFCRANAKSSR